MRKFIVTVNGVSYDVEVEEKDAASVQPAVKEQTRTAVQPAENKPAAVKPAAVSGAGNPVKRRCRALCLRCGRPRDRQ